MALSASDITRARLINRRSIEGLRYLDAYKPVNAKAWEFHTTFAKVRCLFCANQAGKTHTGAADAIALQNGTHPWQRAGKFRPPPLEGRACGVDFPSGVQKILLPKFRELCNPRYLKGGSWKSAYSVRHRVLSWADGGFVEFMSYDQDLDTFGGVQRDWIWCDEEPPQVIRAENQMRLMARSGIEVFTMTFVNGITWVYDEIYEPWLEGRLSDTTKCWSWSLYENPHIQKEEIDEKRKGLSDADVQIRIFGRPVHRTGLVFENFRRRRPWLYPHFDPPPDWTTYVAIDPHPRKNHAVLVVDVSPSGERWAWAEVYKSNDVDETCDELKVKLGGRTPHLVVIDAACKGFDYKKGGISVYEYYCEALAERGILEPEDAFKDRDARVIATRKLFDWDPDLKTDRFIPYDPSDPPAMPTGGPLLHISEQGCPTLLWQLARYIYPTYASRKTEDRQDAPGKPRKKDDDLIDCLGYIEAEEPQWVSMSAPVQNRHRYVDDDEFGGVDEESASEFDTDWRLA